MARPFSSESVFRAVSHSTRRRILELVSRKPRSVADLVAEFRHTQPTLSRHLHVLRQARLIAFKGRGARHLYEAVPGSLRAMRQWVDSVPVLTRRRG
jgi:DNA-binding transcriptional ArsR family regulator